MVWPAPLKVPLYEFLLLLPIGVHDVPDSSLQIPLRSISAVRMAQALALFWLLTLSANSLKSLAVAIWYGFSSVPSPSSTRPSPLSDGRGTAPPISKRRGERDAGDEEQRCQEHAQDAARCFVYHLSSSFPLVVFIRFIIPYCQGFFRVNFAENVLVLHSLIIFGRSTGV